MNKITTLLLTVLVLTAATLPALALGPVDMQADAGIYSKYVWRGLTVTDDPVAQAGVSGSLMGMGFGIWGNMDLTDANANEMEFNEIDYTLTYGVGLPMATLEFGLIYYDFPNTMVDGTAEIYAHGESSLLFSPSLTIFYDFKEVDGGYILAAASHSVPVNTMFDFELGVSAGYGSADYAAGYYGHNNAGLSDFRVSAALPLKMFPMVEIAPEVIYSNLLGDSKDVAGDDSDALVFGVRASFGF
jgi:uncharacterized protein (TIGR02001 family)